MYKLNENGFKFLSVKLKISRSVHGSGCLFQPLTDEYSYVLTAKHVLKDSNSPTLQRPQVVGERIIMTKLEMIGSPFRHPNAQKDAAIIKIPKIEDLPSIKGINDLQKYYGNESFYLAGFPSTRDKKKFSFRSDEIKIFHSVDWGYIEAKIPGIPIIEEIHGQSGGGIIKIGRDHYWLAGIQKGISAENEQLGRIDFMPLSFFNEIVDKFDLASLGLLNYPISESKVEILEKLHRIFTQVTVSPKDCDKAKSLVKALEKLLINPGLMNEFYLIEELLNDLVAEIVAYRPISLKKITETFQKKTKIIKLITELMNTLL